MSDRPTVRDRMHAEGLTPEAQANEDAHALADIAGEIARWANTLPYPHRGRAREHAERLMRFAVRMDPFSPNPDER